MTDDVYEETLKEQADYFGMDVEEVREMFTTFLNRNYQEAKTMDPFERAVCIGIYRIVKLKSACRMAMKSRDRWRDRAMSLGSPGHLVEED